MKQDWIETGRLALPADAIVPMQQHPTYGAACEALGTPLRHFALRTSNGPVIGAAQVLMRKVPLLGRAALLSRGPVWAPGIPAEQSRAGLVRLLDLLRADHRIVAVTPETCAGADPLEGAGWMQAMTPCHMAVLDLTGGVEAMSARQHGKWRNRLRRAESAGLQVHHAPMPADPAHWLLAVEAEQARRRRYRRLPPSFTLAWVAQGGRRSARLFTASQDGKPVAAMLFLLHGPSATYHIGWSGPEGRAVDAHNLLLWQAQLWLASRDVRLLELDLVDTQTTPGLARFKLGSGARVVPLGATRLSAPGTRFFAGRQRPTAPALMVAAPQHPAMLVDGG